MDVLRELARQVEEQLRVASYPLAVKLLESEADVPEGAMRPRRDLGSCLSTCQAFALSRRRGMTVAELKEDMWCPEPVMGFGIEDAPDYFLKGHNRYPGDVASLEAGATWASSEFPRFEAGRYVGVVSAPLASAEFTPDVVVIYCNPAQLTMLLIGIAHRDGRDIVSQLGGHAACVYAVVPPMKTGRCWVSTPCMGDRGRATAGDDEMIFSLPPDAAGDLLAGLRHINKTGRRVPFGRTMMQEYKLSDSYSKIARLMGMRRGDGSEIR